MFKLNIECSKDISELHINFTDGTCSTVGPETHKPVVKEKPKKEKPILRAEEFIDSEDFDGFDNSGISQEKVDLPKIEIPQRTVKVADSLQNLEI